MAKKQKPKSKGQCEEITVTLKLSAVDARWLVNGFRVSHVDHCVPGSQRWNEASELVRKVHKEINKQVNYEFCVGELG